jgi:UDP-N-acetylmuramoyl-tripeptide--D-alanyl-D-alanine ligase
MGAVWGEITISEIQNAIGGFLVNGDPEIEVSGLSTDSRTIKKGDLFWAIKGERYDGHDFIMKALDLGACGLVCAKKEREALADISSKTKEIYSDRVVIGVDDTITALGDFARWWRRKSDVSIAVITGSAGKTTTKEMTSEILSLRWKTLKNMGNFNNLIGLPLTLLSLDARHERAVLEMGMNREGEIKRLTEIAEPDLGLITNVGMAHLEGVGDLQGVARAKTEMVQQMSSDARVIVNGDDDMLLQTATMYRKDITTFGLDKNRDIYADGIRNLGLKGTEFEIFHNKGTFPVKVKVPGIQNVFNALAAAAICLCLEVAEEDIMSGLESFEGIKGRFRVMRLPGDNIIVDDTYNSNPMSLEAALRSVDILGRGMKIIVALGEMLELGNASEKAHIEAGREAARLRPEYFVAMGEHAPEMIKGATDGGLKKSRAVLAESHGDMVKIIKDRMNGGNLVLLKGSRGIQLDKVVKNLVEN